jgi:hypothetical protein
MSLDSNKLDRLTKMNRISLQVSAVYNRTKGKQTIKVKRQKNGVHHDVLQGYHEWIH